MKKIFFVLCVLCAAMMQAQEYSLVWNEDFTDGALDTKVWNIEVNGDGGGNNELQYYCEKGVTLGVEPTTGKQCLILTATKEDYKGKKCTSGRVNTKNKMTYTYGRIDARIKFPNTANGLWPAFWQMGNNFDQVGWPRCGETDIIELGNSNGFNGTQDRYFNGAMHVGSAWNSVWSDAQAVTWQYSVEDTFHIVTMVWTPTSIDMYMDKDAHPEYGAYFHADLEPNENADYNRQLVFGKPNFVIANLAVGGNFPQIWDINKITALANGPRSVYIDWIRIYQRGDANESFSCPSASDEIESEGTQGIEVVESQKSKVESRKVLHNGQLLIRRGEKIYDMLGHEIR
ncbi:MAG: glycoside hydrolase family 16 protein [Paludibacteraceae bacterium]|nr:glycoside hydrolase family 16 protein [Paludibacteraceae bacterium]